MDRNDFQVLEKVFSDKTEHDFEFEAVLPEYCPNIAKVIKVDAHPKITEKFLEKDAVFVSGVTVFRVIYISDYKNQLKSVSFNSDFSNTFQSLNIAEKAGEDPIIEADVYPVSTSFRLQGSRKLILKDKLAIAACVFAHQAPGLYEPDGEDGCIEMNHKEIEACDVIPIPAMEAKLTEEIAIESGMPAIADIIYADAQICSQEFKAFDGRAEYKANVLFKALYEAVPNANAAADEESEYIALSKEIPVSGSIEYEQLQASDAILPKFTVTSLDTEVSYDPYGENRVISLTIGYDVGAKAYRNQTQSICEDAFCTDYACNVIMKPLSVNIFDEIVTASPTITEKIHTDMKNIADVVETFATVQITSTEASETEILLSGKIYLSLIGATESGGMESLDAVINFHVPAGEPNESNLRELVFESTAHVEQASASIENGDLVANITLCVNTAVLKRARYNAVFDIQLDTDHKREEFGCDLLIYYPQENDTVWSVAKDYGVSPDEIRTANKLQDENISKKIILIPCIKPKAMDSSEPA